MGQEKPSLAMMPAEAGSVRARAVARIKTLAAAGATSVIASCGYGVVDPLPPPTCFESPRPTVRAAYLAGADAGVEGDRVVEVKVSFTQSGVTVGDVRVDTSSGGATVMDKQVGANEIRVLLSVQRRLMRASVYVDASCAGASRPLHISLSLGTDSVTANVY